MEPAQLCDFVNWTIAGLNFLHANFRTDDVPDTFGSPPYAVQASAHRHILSRVARFLDRFATAVPGTWEPSEGFAYFQDGRPAKYVDLRADGVDVPVAGATCDPENLLSDGVISLLSNAKVLFPEGVANTARASGPARRDRKEYLLLTARQLAAGILRLHCKVFSCADMFAVEKPNGKQRAIWNGSSISEAAAVPPMPPRLANPSSFLEILVEPGERIYFSKRDASAYFDTLRAPEALQPFFGRPCVTVLELMTATGLSQEEIRNYVVDHPDSVTVNTKVFPASTVWPMGFSWSSFVGQSCMLQVAKNAGIADENILTLDGEAPKVQRELCAVATDDILLFHRDLSEARTTLSNLDNALRDAGLQRNCGKDINLADTMTGLGCDLSNAPPLIEPAAEKMKLVTQGILGIMLCQKASPVALNSLLGVIQWFFLLQRPCYSVLDKVYEFSRREPQNVVQTLPSGVLSEMVTVLMLLPLLPAAMDRGCGNEILATDASPEFGFGVSRANCSRECARHLCGLAEKRGDYVRLFPAPGDPPVVDRLGIPHNLDLSLHDFTDVLSHKAKWQAHSSVLEAHGLLLGIRWAVRAARRHHSRLPVLVDAKAVLGAASKGRSSSSALRGSLRALAANVLAADILLRLIYVPSECMPADAASRGKRRVRVKPKPPM